MSKRVRADDSAGAERDTAPTMQDVLTLNIGGQRLDVLRGTLCLVEGSMLATKFSGRWDEGMPKDRDGNFFVDEVHELFKTMVDFLRLKAREFADDPKEAELLSIEGDRSDCLDENVVKMKAFRKMVDYYGCTTALWPVALYRVGNAPEIVKLTNWPMLSVECISTNEPLLEIFKVWRPNHYRRLKSLDLIVLQGAIELRFSSDDGKREIVIIPAIEKEEILFSLREGTKDIRKHIEMPAQALDVLYGKDGDLRRTRETFKEGVVFTLTFDPSSTFPWNKKPGISNLVEVSIGGVVIISRKELEKYAGSDYYDGMECSDSSPIIELNQPGRFEIQNVTYQVSGP